MMSKKGSKTDEINNNQATGAGGAEEAPVKVNGFAQVLAMLQVADPAFRESLLKRLAARDPALAKNLRRDLDI